MQNPIWFWRDCLKSIARDVFCETRTENCKLIFDLTTYITHGVGEICQIDFSSEKNSRYVRTLVIRLWRELNYLTDLCDLTCNYISRENENQVWLCVYAKKELYLKILMKIRIFLVLKLSYSRKNKGSINRWIWKYHFWSYIHTSNSRNRVFWAKNCIFEDFALTEYGSFEIFGIFQITEMDEIMI